MNFKKNSIHIKFNPTFLQCLKNVVTPFFLLIFLSRTNLIVKDTKRQEHSLQNHVLRRAILRVFRTKLVRGYFMSCN